MNAKEMAAPMAAVDRADAKPKSISTLAVAALGVVVGDIGTSPLYTIKTCLTTAIVQPILENLLGILSLLLWLLAFVVCLKCVGNLMRVDHDGEGGIHSRELLTVARQLRHDENHAVGRLSWLRAPVLGANDGVLSTSRLIIGIASAHASHGSVLVASLSGLVAGSMSM